MQNKESLFEKIKKLVSQIPQGKVSTYGAIAKAVGINDARKVGWAVYGNNDPSIPCHRVVNKQGGLSERFSIGGWMEQRAILKEDGIIFIREKFVDLDEYFWDEFKL
jgi:methylated-DNA-protein-cysteine methyltransferase-like protein